MAWLETNCALSAVPQNRPGPLPGCGQDSGTICWYSLSPWLFGPVRAARDTFRATFCGAVRRTCRTREWTSPISAGVGYLASGRVLQLSVDVADKRGVLWAGIGFAYMWWQQGSWRRRVLLHCRGWQQRPQLTPPVAAVHTTRVRMNRAAHTPVAVGIAHDVWVVRVRRNRLALASRANPKPLEPRRIRGLLLPVGTQLTVQLAPATPSATVVGLVVGLRYLGVGRQRAAR